jgi:hypothetical protein
MPYENIEEPSYLLMEEARKLYADVMPPHPIDIDKAQRLMEGAIDTHIHGGPDAWAKRYWNDIEIAMQAADMGMGAVVIKCHSSPSSRSAQLVQWTVDLLSAQQHKKSIEVIGGVVLNYNVGGLNPEAVNTSALLGGRFVWTPNVDSAHHRKMEGKPGGIAVIDDQDKVVPALRDVFEVVVKHDLVLSLCHHSTKERFIMIDTAKEMGVQRIEIVHPCYPVNKMSVDQMKIAAEKGAFVALTTLRLAPPEFSLKEMMQAINTVGADHFVIQTDLGTWMGPPPPVAYRIFICMLLGQGVSETDIRKMAVSNPERLIF